MSNESVNNLYERVGGWSYFEHLVNLFYECVENDPILRPLYPDDLKPGKFWLTAFLSQYWGGPNYYSELKGHPRLRQRHFPFRIGQIERDAWVCCMERAVDISGINSPHSESLKDYFRFTATFLINKEQ